MNELKNKKWRKSRWFDSNTTEKFLNVMNNLSEAGVKSEDIKVVSIVRGGFGSDTQLEVYYYHHEDVYITNE
jgi:hypothetical protein